MISALLNMLPTFGNSSPSTTKTPIHARNYRIVEADKIPQKLQKQWNLCQKQMNEEETKLRERASIEFKYENPGMLNFTFPLLAGARAEVGRINGSFFNLFGERSFAVCHAQGRRPSMEDQHIATSFKITVNGKEYPVELFGVFDGHGGPEASAYIKKHLPQQLKATLEEFNTNDLSDDATFNALKIAFVRVHDNFKQDPSTGERSGTTATVSMILDGNIWTANTGDSRTILQDGKGEIKQLSEDAKPNDPRYLKGIKNRNGKVLINKREGLPRINGILAVGRAIGDESVGAGINPRPKITKVALSSISKNSRLILACDGIYDVAKTEEVGNAAYQNRNLSNKSLAEGIVYSAYEAGSGDNLSTLVVNINAEADQGLYNFALSYIQSYIPPVAKVKNS